MYTPVSMYFPLDVYPKMSQWKKCTHTELSNKKKNKKMSIVFVFLDFSLSVIYAVYGAIKPVCHIFELKSHLQYHFSKEKLFFLCQYSCFSDQYKE